MRLLGVAVIPTIVGVLLASSGVAPERTIGPAHDVAQVVRLRFAQWRLDAISEIGLDE